MLFIYFTDSVSELYGKSVFISLKEQNNLALRIDEWKQIKQKLSRNERRPPGN
jgi:hypothetical protein